MTRARVGLVLVAMGLFGAMVTAQGCGGTEAPVDAGVAPADVSVADVAADVAPVDAAKDVVVKDTAPACDPTIDPFKDVPDASVGDAGLSTGVCVGCAKSKCKAELDSCVKDCACQGPVIGVLECVLKQPGGVTQASLFACAGPLQGAPTSVQTQGLAIAACLQRDCSAQCIPAGLDLDGGGG
ncbi:MAG: hypothetical protein IPF92_14935 [Myxococcales bacterium]|nr:hypothetical protein [Myxococcales bacterium]MBL0195171.1 hypothetical protein [Myxococcales bacterium]HQY63820.1 hypothetical protein [Polyangiaceae bacterium]